MVWHFKREISEEEFAIWSAYEDLTAIPSGTRDDYRTGVTASLVASFMGDKDATAAKYSWRIPTPEENEHNEKAAQLEQMAYFTALANARR